jgi:hypothetical protein
MSKAGDTLDDYLEDGITPNKREAKPLPNN